MIAPCGTYTNPMRGEPAAAVFLSRVCAGSIASSNGNASVTPKPCKKVRRGRCFFEINILLALYNRPPTGCRGYSRPLAFQRPLHFKRLALDNSGDYRGEPVIITRRA